MKKKDRKYFPPSITQDLIFSEETLRDSNVDEIIELKKTLHKVSNKNSSKIIKVLENKYKINFGDRTHQKREHALGDYSEATTHLFLLESWKVSEQMDIKWIHPDTGTAPKRGIDLTAFSDKNTLKGIDGIIIFEVKGASTESSVKSQLQKIKKFIYRNDTQISQEIQEVMLIINKMGAKLSETILDSIKKDKPLIRLAGSLVTDIEFKDNQAIENFLLSIKQNKSGLPKGLIILYSNNINEEVNKFNEEV